MASKVKPGACLTVPVHDAVVRALFRTHGREQARIGPASWHQHLHRDVDVTIECWPGSSLPDELRTRGYDVSATGDGERILLTAIIERFCLGAV